MKPVLLLSFLIFFISFMSAQKRFEGTITYQVRENERNTNEELTAMFGKAGIKLKYKKENEYDKEVLLINLDSATIYTLNNESKTFTAKKLSIKPPIHDLSDRKIAGFNTHAVDMSGSLGFLGGLAKFGGRFILYRCDSLFYPVPERFSSNAELQMINNNAIVLGADISMGAPFNPDNDEGPADGATITATAVTWQTFDEKEFQVPADFSLATSPWLKDSTAMPDDTITVFQDSSSHTSPLPKQKQSPSNPVKPKTPIKTSPNKEIHKKD